MSIVIPSAVRDTPIAALTVSARLKHVLEYAGVETLADIHGVSYTKLKGFRGCGNKTLDEMRALVRQIQLLPRPVWTHSITWSPYPRSEKQELFEIPENIRRIKLCDLPMSSRLETVLKSRKALKLGDLNGVSIPRLKAMRHCGPKTAAEIVRLITKAADGGFDAVLNPIVEWPPLKLFVLVDQLIAELPPRDKEILEIRFSSEERRMPSFASIGEKLNVTSSRVRQIIQKIFGKMRRVGSRQLTAYLLEIEKVCREAACPFTPQLFTQWLGGHIAALRYSPALYVRLLSALNPSIPA